MSSSSSLTSFGSLGGEGGRLSSLKDALRDRLAGIKLNLQLNLQSVRKQQKQLLEDEQQVLLQVGRHVFSVPRELRVELWLSSLQSLSKGFGISLVDSYDTYLLQGTTREVSVDIDKDLQRTFPNTRRFHAEEGQAQLRNVLRAYAAYDPDVGYCQGMNFVAGLLLMFMPSEAHAFAGLVVLMEHHHLRRFYHRSMSLLQVQLWQLSRLISPKLNQHLENCGVVPMLYGASWLMTAFSADFPIAFSARILDVLLADQCECALLKVAVAIMKSAEKKLLGMADLEDVLGYLKLTLPGQSEPELHKLLSDAFNKPWTARQLAILSSTDGAETVAQAMERVLSMANSSEVVDDGDDATTAGDSDSRTVAMTVPRLDPPPCSTFMASSSPSCTTPGSSVLTGNGWSSTTAASSTALCGSTASLAGSIGAYGAAAPVVPPAPAASLAGSDLPTSQAGSASPAAWLIPGIRPNVPASPALQAFRRTHLNEAARGPIPIGQPRFSGGAGGAAGGVGGVDCNGQAVLSEDEWGEYVQAAVAARHLRAMSRSMPGSMHSRASEDYAAQQLAWATARGRSANSSEAGTDPTASAGGEEAAAVAAAASAAGAGASTGGGSAGTGPGLGRPPRPPSHASQQRIATDANGSSNSGGMPVHIARLSLVMEDGSCGGSRQGWPAAPAPTPRLSLDAGASCRSLLGTDGGQQPEVRYRLLLHGAAAAADAAAGESSSCGAMQPHLVYATTLGLDSCSAGGSSAAWTPQGGVSPPMLSAAPSCDWRAQSWRQSATAEAPAAGSLAEQAQGLLACEGEPGPRLGPGSGSGAAADEAAAADTASEFAGDILRALTRAEAGSVLAAYNNPTGVLGEAMYTDSPNRERVTCLPRSESSKSPSASAPSSQGEARSPFIEKLHHSDHEGDSAAEATADAALLQDLHDAHLKAAKMEAELQAQLAEQRAAESMASSGPPTAMLSAMGSVSFEQPFSAAQAALQGIEVSASGTVTMPDMSSVQGDASAPAVDPDAPEPVVLRRHNICVDGIPIFDPRTLMEDRAEGHALLSPPLLSPMVPLTMTLPDVAPPNTEPSAPEPGATASAQPEALAAPAESLPAAEAVPAAEAALEQSANPCDAVACCCPMAGRPCEPFPVEWPDTTPASPQQRSGGSSGTNVSICSPPPKDSCAAKVPAGSPSGTAFATAAAAVAEAGQQAGVARVPPFGLTAFASMQSGPDSVCSSPRSDANYRLLSCSSYAPHVEAVAARSLQPTSYSACDTRRRSTEDGPALQAVPSTRYSLLPAASLATMLDSTRASGHDTPNYIQDPVVPATASVAIASAAAALAGGLPPEALMDVEHAVSSPVPSFLCQHGSGRADAADLSAPSSTGGCAAGGSTRLLGKSADELLEAFASYAQSQECMSPVGEEPPTEQLELVPPVHGVGSFSDLAKSSAGGAPLPGSTGGAMPSASAEASPTLQQPATAGVAGPHDDSPSPPPYERPSPSLAQHIIASYLRAEGYAQQQQEIERQQQQLAAAETVAAAAVDRAAAEPEPGSLSGSASSPVAVPLRSSFAGALPGTPVPSPPPKGFSAFASAKINSPFAVGTDGNASYLQDILAAMPQSLLQPQTPPSPMHGARPMSSRHGIRRDSSGDAPAATPTPLATLPTLPPPPPPAVPLAATAGRTQSRDMDAVFAHQLLQAHSSATSGRGSRGVSAAGAGACAGAAAHLAALCPTGWAVFDEAAAESPVRQAKSGTMGVGTPEASVRSPEMARGLSLPGDGGNTLDEVFRLLEQQQRQQ